MGLLLQLHSTRSLARGIIAKWSDLDGGKQPWLPILIQTHGNPNKPSNVQLRLTPPSITFFCTTDARLSTAGTKNPRYHYTSSQAAIETNDIIKDSRDQPYLTHVVLEILPARTLRQTGHYCAELSLAPSCTAYTRTSRRDDGQAAADEQESAALYPRAGRLARQVTSIPVTPPRRQDITAIASTLVRNPYRVLSIPSARGTASVRNTSREILTHAGNGYENQTVTSLLKCSISHTTHFINSGASWS